MALAVESRPSPNHGDRAPGKLIDMLILHYTGMASAEAALKWLTDPKSVVSSHYFVFEDGRIVRLVDESRRAWHAGQSWWAGETDINSRSIGIEIANPGHEFGYRPFPDAQIEAVIGLCRDIIRRHPIPPEHVLAHSDVAPRRKRDPGELFPWGRLAEAGIGRWIVANHPGGLPQLQIGERGGAVAELKNRLRSYGYEASPGDAFDVVTEASITALQRHFRPALVDGVADASTVKVLDALLELRRK